MIKLINHLLNDVFSHVLVIFLIWKSVRGGYAGRCPPFEQALTSLTCGLLSAFVGGKGFNNKIFDQNSSLVHLANVRLNLNNYFLFI